MVNLGLDLLTIPAIGYSLFLVNGALQVSAGISKRRIYSYSVAVISLVISLSFILVLESSPSTEGILRSFVRNFTYEYNQDGFWLAFCLIYLPVILNAFLVITALLLPIVLAIRGKTDSETNPPSTDPAAKEDLK
jgi:hypothetical protein